MLEINGNVNCIMSTVNTVSIVSTENIVSIVSTVNIISIVSSVNTFSIVSTQISQCRTLVLLCPRKGEGESFPSFSTILYTIQ